MLQFAHGSYTMHRIVLRFIWKTRYNKRILIGDVSVMLRDYLRHICDSRGLKILGGKISDHYVLMDIECQTSTIPSKIAQYLKGASSEKLSEKFPLLKIDIPGDHLWAKGYFCASIGATTDDEINDYLNHTTTT